jgi:hypothetical protein
MSIGQAVGDENIVPRRALDFITHCGDVSCGRVVLKTSLSRKNQDANAQANPNRSAASRESSTEMVR